MTKEKAEQPKMGDLIKQLPKVTTPVQEVRPVVTKSAAEEQVRINGFWVPAELGRRIKMHSATTCMSQREIMTEALEAYLREVYLNGTCSILML